MGRGEVEKMSEILILTGIDYKSREDQGLYGRLNYIVGQKMV